MFTLWQRYGLSGLLYIAVCKIYTALFFSRARMIRLPFDIRQRGNIRLGNNFTCGKYCRIEAYPESLDEKNKIITFGENVQINDAVHIVGRKKVTIGNNVLIASKVFISDSNHGSYSGDNQSSPDEPPALRKLQATPVTIEDNVWIGEFVTILQGVTIGRGSIIGSLSVVSKDIPANSIAVGSPARVIKQYNFGTKRWEKV